MVRILFVDDEPNILQSLRRALRSHATDLQPAFANSGAEALQKLAEGGFDAIATDLHMPGMDGTALLTAVRERWPDLLRIITSGTCEEGKSFETVGIAHQFLTKPYETATLKDVVARAMRHRDLVLEPGLAAFISGIDRLPSLPDSHRRICDAMRDESRSLQDVGALVAQDIALTAKMLQLVNSAFFALPRRVTSPTEAAVRLGMSVLRGLVMSSGVFQGAAAAGVEAGRLWHHSLEVGNRVRRASGVLRCARPVADAAFLAGMMHEVGSLIFLMNQPDLYRDCMERSAREARPIQQVEQERFGTTHAHVGAYLLGTWGLPDDVVDATAFHHRPAERPEPAIGALTLLHLAESIAAPGDAPDARYLQSIGLLDRLDELRAAMADTAVADPT